MGSLPTQGSGGTSNSSGGGGLVVTSNEDEAFVTSGTFANALVVNLQTIVDSVIQMKNTDVTNAVEYKIYASPKVQGTAPADADDSWYNILNGRLNTPASYNHDKLKKIPLSGRSTESLDNRFAWVRVQLRAVAGTPTVKIWHRGTVP